MNIKAPTTPEVLTPESRASFDERRTAILAALDAGLSPLLPFEHDGIELQLDQKRSVQGELGRLLGKAMTESSETWHDNSAADNISAAAGSNTSQAQKLFETQNKAVDFAYPDMRDTSVTLGSLVWVHYPGEADPEPVLLTGVTRTNDAPETVKASLPEDTEFVTLANSPIGQAMFGRQAGEVISYSAMRGGRQLSVTLDKVEQYQG